jgi:hypothetical protein
MSSMAYVPIDMPDSTDYQNTWEWTMSDGTPYDLTGWTGKADISTAADRTILKSFVVTLGGTAGTITLYLSAANVDALNATGRKPLAYDVLLIDDLGRSYRPMGGDITFVETVTKP